MCDECTSLDIDKPELTLLMRLAVAHMSRDDVAAGRRVLAHHHESLDWGMFLHLAACHRLLPLVGRNLIMHDIAYDDDRRALTPYRQVFAGAYLGNRDRNLVQHAEYARVLRALNEAHIPYLVRKGPVLDTHVFNDLGVRQSSDLDLLVDRRDVEQISALLEPCGYRQGKVHVDGTIQPYSRRAQIHWRTYLNNSLPFVKYAGTIEVDHFKIDLCHEIVQKKSGAAVPTVDLFERARRLDICGVASAAMSEIDQLLDLCLHLYKEATVLYYLDAGKGLRVRQLLDIAACCANWGPRIWDDFRTITESYVAGPEVYFALHYTSLCYPDSVPSAVLAHLRPQETTYLEEYGNLDGRPTRWSGSFISRLLIDGRAVPSRSAVPRS
jgi:hypothetical protein